MIFSTIIRALITMKVKTVEILIAAAATKFHLVHNITSDKNMRDGEFLELMVGGLFETDIWICICTTTRIFEVSGTHASSPPCLELKMTMVDKQ